MVVSPKETPQNENRALDPVSGSMTMIDRIKRLIRSFGSDAAEDHSSPETWTENINNAWSPDKYVPPNDRVLELLERSDGIRPQRDIQQATGWSASKTSRVLSRMEEDGEVARYTVGRQKVVCLPDEEPPHALESGASDE